MRYRQRVAGQARLMPDGLGYEREEIYDEIGGIPPYGDRKCIANRYKIDSDLGQHYSFYWLNTTDNKWYGPVIKTNSPVSVFGPSGFYTEWGVPQNPETPIIQPGFIWKAISEYGKSDVNIGVFLGELKETVAMLHKPWQVAAALATHGPSIPKWIRNVPDAVAWASSSYLGYRYGVKPFLSDVRGFCKLSERLDQRMTSSTKEKPLVLKATRNQTSVSTRVGQYEGIPGPAYLTAWSNSKSITVTMKEWCLCAPSPSAQAMSVARKIANTYHLDDIAGIAWELTPYSFIVDWFLPIGDYIQDNLGAPGLLVNVSQPWGSTKLRVENTNSSVGLSSATFRTDKRFSHTYSTESYNRYPLGSLPPKPVDINGWQKLDLALIAGQTLSGILGKSFKR